MPTLHGRVVALGILFTAALAVVGAGCTERKAANERPVIPSATPTALAALAGDFQQLRVKIVDGKFENDRYSVQPHGRVRLVVEAEGGPYTMQINQLMGTTQVQADGVTEVHLTTPNPGDYTMSLEGPNQDTAVLNVRPVGGA